MSHHTSLAPSPKRPLKVVLLGGALLIGLLGLGYYGWVATLFEATGKVLYYDALTHTVELATGENAVVVGDLHEPHWTLVVALWGIKALLAAAIFQSAAYFFRQRLKVWRFQRVSGHDVFLGLASFNPDLAKRSLSDGLRVAVIDSNGDHAERASLEARSVLFLSGSPMDLELLRSAGVSRARRVITDMGSDEQNVAVAERAASLIKPDTETSVEILVPLASSSMRDLLRERWGLMDHATGSHIRLVGFRHVALRSVLSRLAESLPHTTKIPNRAPRILLACDREFSMELLDLAIPFLQLSGSALPSYDVCGVAVDEARRFFKKHADLGLVAEVAFHPESAGDASLVDGLIDRQFDFAVVHLESEVASLAVAESILRSPTFHVGQVLVLTDALPVIRIKPDDRLQVISLFTHGLNSPEFGDLTLEKAAKENHETYLAELHPAERENAPQWATLGEAFKDSNRWAVLHRQAKLAVWKHAEESSRSELIELLACSEHQRWVAEKIMTGWRAGATRDNRRKIHPDILPYDQLAEDAKEKDRVQVRKALGLDTK